MGVNFSHCKAHWSYSGFNRFRGKLASHFGIAWPENIFEAAKIMDKKWEAINHPVMTLLNHSDCDGHIDAEKCYELADVIEPVITSWEFTNAINDYTSGLELIKGLRLAGDKKEKFVFD